MFAVIKTGGKQYRVAADDVIEIDKIAGETGEAIAFGEVLAVGGEETVLGTPTVAGASVKGEVVEQGRKPTVIAFKKRRRKNSRRKRGHRQEFTLVRITAISVRRQGTAEVGKSEGRGEGRDKKRSRRCGRGKAERRERARRRRRRRGFVLRSGGGSSGRAGVESAKAAGGIESVRRIRGVGQKSGERRHL